MKTDDYDITESEVRAEFLKVRASVISGHATVSEVKRASDLIDALILFQKVRDHEPKK